jgi:hypothetical protein
VLHETDAGSDDQGLTERMGVPGRSRAGLEGDGAAADPCRRAALETTIDTDCAGEVLRSADARWLGAGTLDRDGLRRLGEGFGRRA